MNASRSIWPGGARLALSIVVNVEEGSELSVRDGDRGPDPVDELGIALRSSVRNLANESNYRYGIRAGAARVLSLLDQYGVRATFAAAAVSLERAPDLARRIVQAGHEVCAHGWRWIHQHRMSESEERAFVRKAVSAIQALTGHPPRGWLSRYLITENTSRILAEEGFSYHMDDYSDDRPFWRPTDSGPILILPYALDSNDMKMWIDPAYTPSQWLQYAKDSFDWLYAEGCGQPRMMSLGVHLRIIGRPGRIGHFQRFLEYVKGHDAVWVATRAEIAAHWRERHPAPAR